MHRLYVSLRLTHRYVGTYKHEDKWRDLGRVKVTPARVTQEPRDYDDGGAYVRWATLPSGLSREDRRELMRGLEDTLTSQGCSHEYDCCGCRSDLTYAYPTRNPRRVRLVTQVSFNY